jgi:hypothetical protein
MRVGVTAKVGVRAVKRAPFRNGLQGRASERQSVAKKPALNGRRILGAEVQ